MAKDFYKILGVSRGASADDIQKAYRVAARKYHPDLNPDDKTAKERFQEVQSAYEVLNDPDKRQMYDRYGDSFDKMGAGGPAGGGPGNPFQDVDLNDIFGGAASGGGGFADLFRQFTQGGAGGPRGNSRRNAAPARGKDLRHEVMISFHTAVLGGEAPVTFRDTEGRHKTITIKIPAGIEDGRKIRLRGQGEPAPRRGGKPGDLLVTVRVGAHPCYRRQGDDLEVTVPITLLEAVEGAKVDVPTPKGTISLTIPPKSVSGKRLRVRGMGVDAQNGKKGDLLAEVQIVLPERIDDSTLELLRQVEATRRSNPREDLKW